MSEIDYSNACIYKIQCKDPSVIPVYRQRILEKEEIRTDQIVK